MFLSPSSLARFYENCQEKERATLFANHTLLDTTTLLERKIFNEVLGFEVPYFPEYKTRFFSEFFFGATYTKVRLIYLFFPFHSRNCFLIFFLNCGNECQVVE